MTTKTNLGNNNEREFISACTRRQRMDHVGSAFCALSLKIGARRNIEQQNNRLGGENHVYSMTCI